MADCGKFVNDLNIFYGRYDVRDPKIGCSITCDQIGSYEHIQLSEEEVAMSLSKIRPNKAPGPDGLQGRVLKVCSQQLKGVLTQLFQILLNCGVCPNSWKKSTIIPVPKVSKAIALGDFRPVALTPLLAKCMERVVSTHLMSSVGNQLDPLQFAYRSHRGTEDATLTLVNQIAKHLQQPKSLARVLFIDFTSAFNTMQTDILLEQLHRMNVNGGLIHWIRSFLTDRPQRVLMNGVYSDELVINTGAPQGCVLSPLLFSIYINDMTVHSTNVSLLKYSDDMALVGLLTENNAAHEEAYFSQVTLLQDWCQTVKLEINVTKTKELIIQTKPRGASNINPVVLDSRPVEVVENFKYLGTIIDRTLSFNVNSESIFKRANQRMFLIRKLRSFRVSQHILEMAYRGLVESILQFNITAWYGNLNVKDKNKLSKIVNTAGKVIGKSQRQLGDVFDKAVLRKARQISTDTLHPLNSEFELLPSGRRFRVPRASRNIYKRSFIPHAIQELNLN